MALTFTGVAPGSTPLSFASAILGDELGDPIAVSLAGSMVTVAPIPEPTTLVLTLAGLLTLVLAQRRAAHGQAGE